MVDDGGDKTAAVPESISVVIGLLESFASVEKAEVSGTAVSSLDDAVEV